MRKICSHVHLQNPENERYGSGHITCCKAGTPAGRTCNPSFAQGFISDRGNLLPRKMADIEINLVDFKIVEIESQVVACAALELFPNELGEVRSLAVDQRFDRLGLGSKLVAQLIDEAEKRNLNRLMALTYVPEFFHTLGFQTVPKATLPEKVLGNLRQMATSSTNCDEIAVLRLSMKSAGNS